MPTKIHWKTLSIILGVFVVAFFSYSIYSYHKLTDGLPAGPPLQMSRIDFQEKVDSVAAHQIQQMVIQTKGVQHAYFNIEDDILVYSHDPQTINSQAMFSRLEERFALAAQRYVVDESLLAGSCPVTGQNSIFIQLGGYITRLFQS